MRTPVDLRPVIESFLNDNESISPRELVELASVSRQTASRHLRDLCARGLLVKVGQGPATRYQRVGFRLKAAPQDIDEAEVARDVLSTLRRQSAFSPQGQERLLYAVSEIVNNAIDHAEAREVVVEADIKESLVRVIVSDDGVGALFRVAEGAGLDDLKGAVIEISKGRMTTDPKRHSGEGLFFVSKVAEHFRLDANGFAWIVDNVAPDEGLATSEVMQGTRVAMWLSPDTKTALHEVFDRFTTEFEFNKSRTRIKLLSFGTRLISRSEAKRLVARLEAFDEVELDFSGVEGVGQGFVDEVFRVWHRDHKGTHLLPTNMNEAVEFMVMRGLARAAREG